MDEWHDELKGMFRRQQEIWLLMSQLQNEVGKLVIMNSDMENKLRLFFMALTAPTDDANALKVLKDQQSSEKKINLIDLLVQMQCTDEEKTTWNEVHTVLSESRMMRNLVAHQSAWISDHDADEAARVFLGPHSIAPKYNKEATAHEIGLVCNRLIKGRATLLNLLRDVGLRKGLIEVQTPEP
ncbi:hypothetical protein [Methylobacterium sp. 37f]|uniref:hypothetical protein n=1 Tax=Methylobacterium sp. 37f TaxID=2817058 RepID=UPI001FFCF551|nr:hypothetical protein [Methylobacterium sp. 37f]MCK2054759.1 hypothetical protein [Methylobacterium sp. 37f]